METHSFSKKKCVPCEGSVAAIAPKKAREFLKELPDWTLSSGRSITSEYLMKDFMSAIRFIDALARLAEKEGHHPDISIHDWNKVTLTLSTHSIGGLSENDFILAAKIDKII